MTRRKPTPAPVPDLWAHRNGSAHSAAGPLGCLPCANERRSALARCHAGSATDDDRAALAEPSPDGRRMLGPAECQRCSRHPRRRETFRWVWPAGGGPEDASDVDFLRSCPDCVAEES